MKVAGHLPPPRLCLRAGHEGALPRKVASHLEIALEGGERGLKCVFGQSRGSILRTCDRAHCHWRLRRALNAVECVMSTVEGCGGRIRRRDAGCPVMRL